MSHLDEGTLHALLEGELENGEVQQVQAHLVGCAACDSRLKEVRELLAEADRLVGAMEPPPAAAPMAPSLRPADPTAFDAPPVLLLPDAEGGAGLRRGWYRGLGVAALLAVAAGGGYLIAGARGGRNAELRRAQEGVPDVAMGSERSGVMSPLEAAPATSADSAGQRGATTRPAPTGGTSAGATSAGAARDTASVARGETGAGPQPSDTNGSPAPRRGPRSEPAARRAQAAKATQDLEDEIRRTRARAATAALDSARRAAEQRAAEQRAADQRAADQRAADQRSGTEAAREPAASSAPAVRTIDQRAQTYLRIGLDEAARQLGRPVHVIEGMSPQFLGLARGRQVPGADSTRPVVRVVYQDPAGRMILLDQQRILPGQQVHGSGGTRWSVGDVLLYLHGELAGDALTNLRRRVR